MHWTLRSLCKLAFGVVGVLVCHEAMQRVVRKLGLTYKRAHKLLGKASAPRRAESVQQLRELVTQSQQDDGPLVIFTDESVWTDRLLSHVALRWVCSTARNVTYSAATASRSVHTDYFPVLPTESDSTSSHGYCPHTGAC